MRFSRLSIFLLLFVPHATQAQLIAPCPPYLVPTSQLRSPSQTTPQVAGPVALPLYSIGQPTDEETYVLECINRARMDPKAEGHRLATTTDPDVSDAYTYFKTPTRAMVEADFQTYPARSPFAFNEQLIASGRGHDSVMFAVDSQYHVGPDGSPQSRATAKGYPGYAGESAYAYAASPWHMHAVFQIDFGNPGLGHRNGNMNFSGEYTYNEIGICIVHLGDGYPGMGPLVTCQEFGIQYLPGGGNKTFLCGVVYDDKNDNKFYDIGEGLGGVTITATDASFSAVTSASGAYTIPYSQPGEVTVTASGAALGGTMSKTITFEGENVKIDFTPQTPQQVMLLSPASGSVFNTDTLTVSWSPINLATKYRVQVATDTLMKTLVVNDSALTTTKKLLTGLKDTVTYYWRAAAKNASGWAPYSAIRTFTTILPPAPVTLDLPANKATVPQGNVKFTWREAKPRVTAYWFQLSASSQMTDLLVSDSTSFPDATSTSIEVDARMFEAGKTYYWKVLAQNDGGWSVASAPRSFTLSTLGVKDDRSEGNSSLAYPNPTSGSTSLYFKLDRPGPVSVSIFNSLGECVYSVETILNDGLQLVPWDAREFPNGVYTYQLSDGRQRTTGKIVKIK